MWVWSTDDRKHQGVDYSTVIYHISRLPHYKIRCLRFFFLFTIFKTPCEYLKIAGWWTLFV